MFFKCRLSNAMQKLWLVLILVLPSGALPIIASAGDAATILVLGDSISAAYNMESSQSWPSLMQNRLDQHG